MFSNIIFLSVRKSSMHTKYIGTIQYTNKRLKKTYSTHSPNHHVISENVLYLMARPCLSFESQTRNHPFLSHSIAASLARYQVPVQLSPAERDNMLIKRLQTQHQTKQLYTIYAWNLLNRTECASSISASLLRWLFANSTSRHTALTQ